MATMTFEERKEKVNELRKAHFQLGFKNENTISDYKENYTEKEIARKQKEQNEEFEQYRKNPRQSHYELGTDQQIPYNSQAKDSYKQYDKLEQVALSEETKSDLRKHHFSLGFHSVEDPSEYKRQYLEKEKLKADLDQKQMKIFLTKHNHDFGNAQDIYKTTYDTIHNKGYDPDYLKQVMTKEQLKDKTLELRKTNLVIGNQPKQFQSHSNAIYQPKPITAQQGRAYSLKQSNTVLGSDNPMNKTVHQTTYQGNQPNQRIFVNKEQGRDFRANHFDLATTKQPMPETTMKEAFKNVGQDSLNSVQNPALQKTHFHVDMAMTNQERDQLYLSIYKAGIGAGVPYQDVEFAKGNNGSTILLGSDAVNAAHYKSEAMKKQVDKIQINIKSFVDYPGYKKFTQDRDVINHLQNHHYELGEDKQTWKTHNQEYNKTGPKTKLDPDTLKDLRKHHFVTGSQKGDYYLHSWAYGSKLGPPNVLNGEKADDLRQHHFKETGITPYETSYQVQTSNLK